jgi:peptidoglycan/LPS O-acetylase OafA/YrhL
VLPHSNGLFYPPNGAASKVMLEITPYGGRGVQLFFVISGFVIAYSLRDATRQSFSLKTFILRRAIRLDPPYWVAIFAAWASTVIQAFITHRATPIPSLGYVLAHMFYLQGILDYGQINVVFWTLCVEFQLYIVFAVLLVVSEWLAPPGRLGAVRAALVIAGFLGSLALARTVPAADWPGVWFIRFWYMFLAGVLLCWHMLGRVSLAQLGFCAACMIVSFVWSPDSFKLSALLAAGVIYLALRRGTLSTWLAGRGWQFFGRLSYGIYLMHVPIALFALGIRTRLSVTSPILPFVLLGCLYLAVIAGAYLLHVTVEAPCLRLAARLKTRLALRPAAPAPEVARP